MFAAAVAAFCGLVSGHRLHDLPARERAMWLRLWLAVLFATLALALFAGCSGVAEAIRAAGTDTNSVAIDVQTVWGSGHYRRNLPGWTQ